MMKNEDMDMKESKEEYIDFKNWEGRGNNVLYFNNISRMNSLLSSRPSETPVGCCQAVNATYCTIQTLSPSGLCASHQVVLLIAFLSWQSP